MDVTNLKNYKVYSFQLKEDEEGGKYEGWSDTEVLVPAYIYPAGGQIQAEAFGERMAYMLNMMVNLPCVIKEKDGVCVDNDKVDYRVKSIQRYTEHAQILLERVVM